MSDCKPWCPPDEHSHAGDGELATPRQTIVCPVCGHSTRTVRHYEPGSIVLGRMFPGGTTLVECVNPMCDSNLPPISEEERS